MKTILEIGDTVLRAPEDADLVFLHDLRNDLKLQMLLMVQPRPNSMQRVREWVARVSGDERSAFFVVADRPSGEPCGFAQLTHIDGHHGTAELGICMSPQMRGRSHGANAMAMIEDYAWSVFGIRKIVLRVLARNERAIKFYLRLNFTEVGTHKRHFLQSGQMHDVLIMEKFIDSAAARTI